jgi:hypothetical protein
MEGKKKLRNFKWEKMFNQRVTCLFKDILGVAPRVLRNTIIRLFLIPSLIIKFAAQFK